MSKFKTGPLTIISGGVVALVIAGLFIVFFQVPQRLGWMQANDPQLADASGEHAGHDHSDHSDHDHDRNGDADHDAPMFDAPPMGLVEDVLPGTSDDDDPSDHDHSGHNHDHASEDAHDHDSESSLVVSRAARENLGLQVAPATLRSFTQYEEIPATIRNWPGRTHISVASPLTGVISAIHIARGEMISSGAAMFSLRLTHQDLVNAQQQFLAKLGQLDVEQREIERLRSIANSGAVAGKTLINRQYERDRLLADIEAAKQSMLLHGLTTEQVAKIEASRQLVREVTVFAPILHEDRSLHHDATHKPVAQRSELPPTRFAALKQPPPSHERHVETELLVTELEISRGESVAAGQQLARLSDYSSLLIEGHAFQRDGQTLRQAARSDAALQAVIETSAESPEIIDGLSISYIGNEVDPLSRSLPFYVELTNEVERGEVRDQQRYVSWRFKPGQRLRLRVPVANFGEAIVVPQGAVADEGVEAYVFVDNGDHFDRVEVNVVGRDSLYVAIAPNGQLRPGQPIAIKGARQLLMALRNQTGGGIDPHAGHNH